MFGKIAGFEFRYQIRQPVFWVVAIVFFLLTFGAMTVDQIQIGSGGNIKKNASLAIVQIHMIWSLFFMFVTTAFVANVVVRDDDTGFGPIVRATRVSKFDYLIGRFAGALPAALLCFLSVPLAILVGSAMPWVDPETIAAFNPAAYLFAYGVLAIPNILLTAALFFALATVTRSMMATYVGVVGLFVGWIVLSVSLQRPEWRDVLAVAEPFGAAALAEATRYWTTTEANTRVPELTGVLLYNRLLWTGVAFAALAAAYALFRFQAKGAKPDKAEKPGKSDAARAARAADRGPLPKGTFGLGTGLAQLWARTRFDMGQVFKSPAYFVLLALGIVNSVASLWLVNEIYGSENLPVTRVMIQQLLGAFSLIPIIVAIYYSGELVWRERDRKTHEIVDATPLPDWAFVAPKTLAIVLVLISTLLVSVVTAIAIQALRGYTDFEIGKYLYWYVLPQAIDWTLLAILAVFLQALSPHKFVGWGLMVLFLIFQITAGNIGWDDNLYNYAGSSSVPLSDINGAGDFMGWSMWFRGYWGAFAVILLVLTYVLWRRGTETRLLPRLARLPRRLAGPAGALGGAALVAMIGLGVFIYTNTHVWNVYRNNQSAERFQADYEKALARYIDTPQPKISNVRLQVDLHPREPRLDTKGVYTFENRTNAPISDLHVRFDPDLEVLRVAVPGARLVRDYDRFAYRIYRFEEPLQPGESRTLTFETRLAQRGFRNSGNLTSVVDNGTFVNDAQITPRLGMDRQGFLQERADRRKYGLEPQDLRLAKLEDPAANAHHYLRRDAEWVTADITVTTDADQTPIAPGYKVSERVANGRRTVRFQTEAPILPFFSIQSARYAVKSTTHEGVELSVYHHPGHDRNVDRMLDAMKVSLDYFQANFSPYQFRQLRVLEFPAYGTFAQAFANTVPYSESIGFIADLKDPEKIDYVTYVTAHEAAHQWWAHQIIGAEKQGMTSLSETLAQYSALMVMEELYGPDKIRQFLKFELDRYLSSRGSDVIGEQPLMRVENQAYIHYQKGALVMYRLKDEIGEAAVNRALASLLNRYAFRGAPFPTSLDLVSALRAEAGPEHQALITDLFERITIYDLKVADVTSTRRPDGRFDVAVTVEARKLYSDSEGKETEAPLNERFDIGLFASDPTKAAFGPRDVITLEKQTLRSGRQTFRFTAARAPVWVGVDPYNKAIDRNSDDNLRRVGS